MEDENIIDLYWHRSETAIVETSIKYGHYCRTISFNILNNIEDSEECENDAYVSLWNTIPPTHPNSLKAFLGRLIRNISLDRYDYNKAKKRNSELNIILSELEECIPDIENKYTINENGDISKAISTFLYTLDKSVRCVFVRRYWYSDSLNAISQRYNMSESKIKSMLFRTRNKLKMYLKKEGIEI